MRSRSLLLLIIIAAFGLIVAACEVDDADDAVADEPAVEVADDDGADESASEPDSTPTEAPATPEPDPTATAAPETDAGEQLAEMTIYHFDVGQADATLIDAPDVTILIDTGDWQRDDVVSHVQSVGVDSLDLLILTHPHADHIGQMPQVMQSFNVTEVWASGWEHDTATFERALDAIIESDAGYHAPRAGETETFGDVVVEVIHPVEPLEDIHDGVAVRIVYGEFAALYTGDADVSHETEMLSRDHNLSANVLQLGHHGSHTSTSVEFLDAVNLDVAIYSAGQDNEYGHPHGEVVSRVQGAGIELYGTSAHGTVIVTTDGETYEVSTEREGEVVAPDAAPEPEPEPTPEAEPATQLDPDQVGLEFVEVVGGPPGSTATATVQATPGAACSIAYTTPAGTVSQAQGLGDTTADGVGIATWTWNIGPNTTPGEGTVRVTCNGESASSPITIGG